ncbi:Zn-ribbon domain-containing OB-fold protein [Acuticoccus kandeliae]|uniref:Zn-ribbon domain-containing OB-fold protein n=1 Tax=Acuticoccus kandeliae TaxID=2073160 RepID=UPI000D3E4A92|nr:Zn-ribbon domain-containing OB-fold protein [Acuticoccus kandeliae]
MIIATRTGPAPAITPETEPYWEAAREGRLLVRRCTSCGEAHHYPRSLCPFCFGDTVWETSAGTGEIYSYSYMAKAEQPYVIAYVRLDDGPILMTNIVDTAEEDLAIGARVSLVFRASQDGVTPLPMFKVSP